jgi:hypothetical protein
MMAAALHQHQMEAQVQARVVVIHQPQQLMEVQATM